MDEYRSLAVFAAVAEAGSFSAAGRRLKLSTSVVSHHVTKLEAHLGASLFFRSTRSLSLTPEGKAILPAARAMVRAAQEALDALTDSSDQPKGALRVTLPAFGENSPLTRKLLKFGREYPLVTLTIHSGDLPVDLVKEGFDLAIRLGVLRDSALMSRRIGTFHRKLVASPDYLAQHPPVETVEGLAQHDFISLAMLDDEFTLFRGKEEAVITPEHLRLEVHSLSAAKAAVLAGLGYRHLPESEVKAELRAGELVELLPDWSLPELGVYAVWPDSGLQKKLTRRLIDYLALS